MQNIALTIFSKTIILAEDYSFMRHVVSNQEFYTDYARFTENLMNLIDYPHIAQAFQPLVPARIT